MTTVNKQSGAVLVVSLVMLLLLTMIGLAGTQETSMEEKMASNSRNQNLAFQMAESALRAGEANIVAITALSAFDGNNGLLGDDDSTPGFSSAAVWADDAHSIEYDSGDTDVATQPRYFVKYIGNGEGGGRRNPGVGGYGESTAGGTVSYFEVIARGSGGKGGNSRVFLKSYYGKRF